MYHNDSDMGWDGMGWDGMGWDGMEWDDTLNALQAASAVKQRFGT